MKKIVIGFSVFLSFSTFAATEVDLSQQSPVFLKQLTRTGATAVTFAETSRIHEPDNSLHIRVQQTYRGYSVWGGDGVVHIPGASKSKKALLQTITPNTTMNGYAYQNLDSDLVSAPTYIFTDAYKEKALAHVMSNYRQKNSAASPIDFEKELIVFLDQKNKAHWAFYLSFFVPASQSQTAEKPAYIIDAANFTVYEQWNDLRTFRKVNAGGYGGNHKTGQKIFNDLPGNQTSFLAERDDATNTCYMRNAEINVIDYRRADTVTFACPSVNPEHNNVYWSGNFDAVRTTWSPSNDSMFGAKVASEMYRLWYGVPMLKNRDGSPMFLPITVHDPATNAYWRSGEVIFGDSKGSSRFNPFSSLDTVVHEISHGFTEQHSNLYYFNQSGGINESYSDIAGIVGEYYAFGKTDFLVGWGDVTHKDKALRYMETPSKDCEDVEPGNSCSIDDVTQYKSGMEVHDTAGIFNRAFFYLAKTPNWDPKKAFRVFVKANRIYWTRKSNFKDAACGVMKASRDEGYDLNAVANAFNVVKINTSDCFKTNKDPNQNNNQNSNDNQINNNI